MERWKAKVEICGGSRKAPDGEGREGGRGWVRRVDGEEGGRRGQGGGGKQILEGRAAFERCEGRRLGERERGKGETKGGIESVQRS